MLLCLCIDEETGRRRERAAVEFSIGDDATCDLHVTQTFGSVKKRKHNISVSLTFPLYLFLLVSCLSVFIFSFSLDQFHS